VNGRLIIDEPALGAWNMSVDAAILAAFRTNDRPTLRFYRWSQPTLSLGYFQSIQDRAMHPESQGLDLVRRATGGGAIVHDRELTYSLTVPHATQTAGGSTNLYQAVHECIIASLTEFGVTVTRFGIPSIQSVDREPFLCFQRRTEHDLVLSGYKVCGSAQRRSNVGLLQHGSLLLSTSQASPQLPGLIELSGGTTDAETFPLHNNTGETQIGSWWDQLNLRITNKVATEIGVTLSSDWSEGSLSSEELDTANEVHRERFGCGSWTSKR